MLRYGMYAMVRYGMVLYGKVWFVWYGMLRYGLYGTVWYAKVWYCRVTAPKLQVAQGEGELLYILPYWGMDELLCTTQGETQFKLNL